LIRLLLGLGLVALVSHGPLRSSEGSDGVMEVGPFSRASGGLPPGWEPLEFPKIPRHTRYDLVLDEGTWVVRAESDTSASGLIRRVRVDLSEYPILRWRWKVERSLARGDVTSKQGDDYAARLYLAFEHDPSRVGLWKRVRYAAARALYGDLPIGAITYIWASRGPVGSIVDNPYAGSFVKMIVVRSGPSETGEWHVEQRNVRDDFLLAFGEEPTPVEGVAIMTDTDDTGEVTTAYYGDIVFLRASSP
jgi:hypothetical protein